MRVPRIPRPALLPTHRMHQRTCMRLLSLLLAVPARHRLSPPTTLATLWRVQFEVAFFQPDFEALVAQHVAQGGIAADLIEPGDGFHPSQLGQALFAQQVWDHLEAHYPHALGPVNPHNTEIELLFGDQGGF
jgi:hypothetical protein